MKKITAALGQTFVLPVAHAFIASWTVYLISELYEPKVCGFRVCYICNV